MILASIFVCFCLASAFNYYQTRRQRRFVSNLKGPFTWPLVGSMHKLVLLTPRNFFKHSASYLSKYGDLSRCWVFHRLFIPVADLELAKQLLHSEAHQHTGYELMRNFLGHSVLNCPAEEWQQRHQLLATYFEPARSAQLMNWLQEQAEKPCKELMLYAESREVFNAWQVVSQKVLDCILPCTLGVQPSEQYKKAFADLMEIYRERFLSIKSANRLTFWLSAPFTRRRQQRLIKRLNEETLRILVATRPPTSKDQLKHKQVINMEHSEPKLAKLSHQSLLYLLIESDKLTDEQLIAELNTCNLLGYLLCSTALCFALVLIARHPAVQQRCLEEVRSARKENEWNLQGMPYLEAVLKETLRLQPPQLILNRELEKDFSYTHSKVGDAALPAGAEVYINLYEMQRSVENFGQLAQHFQPERFLDNSSELLSFGLGPRLCPAQEFSLMLLKCWLAPLLLQYELLPFGDAVRPHLQLAMGSKNGFQLALKLRTDFK